MPQIPSRSKQLLQVERDIAILYQRLARVASDLVDSGASAVVITDRVAKELSLAYANVAKIITDKPVSSGVYADILKVQKSYLKGFRKAIASKKLSNNQIIARAASYARSEKQAFHAIERDYRKRLGFNQAKRNLDRRPHEVCDDCDRYARMGWVGIDNVILPGQECQCHGNCRCDVVYRKV